MLRANYSASFFSTKAIASPPQGTVKIKDFLEPVMEKRELRKDLKLECCIWNVDCDLRGFFPCSFHLVIKGNLVTFSFLIACACAVLE